MLIQSGESFFTGCAGLHVFEDFAPCLVFSVGYVWAAVHCCI